MVTVISVSVGWPLCILVILAVGVGMTVKALHRRRQAAAGIRATEHRGEPDGLRRFGRIVGAAIMVSVSGAFLLTGLLNSRLDWTRRASLCVVGSLFLVWSVLYALDAFEQAKYRKQAELWSQEEANIEASNPQEAGQEGTE